MAFQGIVKRNLAPFRNPADKGVDLDYFNGTMYELRGVADIGRPGVAFVSGSVSVAHSELDDHLRLLTNDGSNWIVTDLGQGDLPDGGADPVLLESGGALFLYFRSGDAVIEATPNSVSSWETKDLTAISLAKPIHDPRAVMDGDKRHVVYWAEDNDWYLLTCDNGWMSVGVLHDAQLGTSTGQPVVFVQGGLPHVTGRIDGDGHLWDIWPDLAGGWKTEDITALALANDSATPAATYPPCAYETSAGVTLAFRAVGGEIWVIHRTTNTPTNVGAAAHAARSLGHPTCFVLNDIPHVVYRGIDGIMYDLSTDSDGAWQAQSICDDKMAADPVATTDGTNGAVAARAGDGMIHVALFNGSDWACNPTTIATPTSTGTPAPDSGGNDKSVG